MQLTIKQLFGEGAIETTSSLIIQKTTLTGLTASSSNGAEQLLAAIILNVKEQFTGVVADDLGNQLVSENDTPITYDNSILYECLLVEEWRVVSDNQKIIHTFLVRQFNTL